MTGLFIFKPIESKFKNIMHFIPVYPYLNWINELLDYKRCYSNGPIFIFNLVHFVIFSLCFIITCFIGLIILNIIRNNFSTNNLDSKFFYLKSKPINK